MNLIKKSKTGKTILIREIQISDASAVIDYLNLVGGESNNLTFGKDEFGVTVKQEETFIESINKNPNSLMLVVLYKDEIIAQGSVMNDNTRKRLAHNSELGITVKKAYWNEGIGSILIQELLKFVDQHEYLTNVQLAVNGDNVHAINLYRKHGFIDNGYVRDGMCVNGEYYDEVRMIYYRE